MAEQKGKVKFIRVKGRVVPIKDKGGSSSAKSSKKKSKKSRVPKGLKLGGDAANKNAQIDSHYEDKALKKSGSAKWGAAAAAGFVGSVLLDVKGKRGAGAALFAAAVGSAVYGGRKTRAARKSLEEKKYQTKKQVFGKNYTRSMDE